MGKGAVTLLITYLLLWPGLKPNALVFAIKHCLRVKRKLKSSAPGLAHLALPLLALAGVGAALPLDGPEVSLNLLQLLDGRCETRA